MRHPLAILLLIAGASLPAGALTLKDVPQNHWAKPAVEDVTVRYGLMSGYSDGRFHGHRPITRYEFAAAMRKLMERLENRFADTKK